MSEIMKNTSVVPDGWSIVSLGDVLQYEQPYYYTVTSDDYNDIAGTPVLTAGKSFLLGYTTEVENVYNNLPVIIFDDFTTDSKFVDFPFKVKSSAMKFLKPKEENVIDLRLIFEFIQKLKISVANADHKRRWISEFSKIKILIPSYPEQQHIAKILSTADSVIEKTQAAIAKYKAIKQGMLQDLFTRGIDLNTNKLRPRYEDAPELYKESKLGMIPREWDDDVLGNIISVSSGEGLTQENIKPGIHLIYGGNGINGSHSEYLFEDSKLIIGRVGEYCGNAYITKPFSWVTDNALVVTPLKKVFLMNLWQYYLNFLDLNSLAFVGAQPVITGGLINKVVVKEIPEDEQILIAERLKTIDNKLHIEQTYLQKMQSLKKGLMEDLLSGRKQVKVAEEVLTQSEN